MSSYFSRFPTLKYDIFGTGKPIELTDIFRAVRLKKNTKDDVLLYTYYEIQEDERPDHVSLKLYGTTDYYWTFFMINDTLINLAKDWPLSRSELENKINRMYAGNVMIVDEEMGDKFIKNEVLYGLQTGATATITEKDTNLGQIKLTNIVGSFKQGEAVVGRTSGSRIINRGVIPYVDAAHHYENVNGEYVSKHTLHAVAISNADYERGLNTAKTKIKVLRPEYVLKISEEFFKQINPEAQ